MTWVWYILFAIALAALCGLSLRYYFPFRIPKDPNLPRAFMYHATDIAPWPGMRAGLNVNPTLLEFQLRYLKAHGYTFVTATELISFAPTSRHVCLTFDDGYEDNYVHLFPLLKTYQAKATVFAATRCEYPGKPMLTDAQMREMADSGLVEFGGHTLSHVRLPELDDATAEREIQEGKAWIERVTGRPCVSFAYPFGRYTPREIEMLKRLGFQCAFTCEKGIRRIEDPYTIDRLSAHGEMTTWQFPLVLSRGKFKI
ncbi:MAG: polysaccharide deacetylase family protein [Kiritimatiellaeota bacterium]|nr:polysaccharide deacetylase family protein [Kiritimatiellota bacterium]